MNLNKGKIVKITFIEVRNKANIINTKFLDLYVSQLTWRCHIDYLLGKLLKTNINYYYFLNNCLLKIFTGR